MVTSREISRWKAQCGESRLLRLDEGKEVRQHHGFYLFILNIKLLLNEAFDKACQAVYSPRNAFCISRNDGLFNNDVNIFKDTVINLESFVHMGRKMYSPDQITKIKALKAKYAG